VTWRLVVMISGTGSNATALLDALADGTNALDATVVAMGADRDAPGLEEAKRRGIPTFIVSPADYPDRETWGQDLGKTWAKWEPDLVVLSGFMRLLPSAVVEEFSPRVINTHPAYLPEFPGAHGVADALQAGVSQTGASVILVDAGVDSGPILARERVAVLSDDDEASLHERIKQVERRLLYDVLGRIVRGELDLARLGPGGTAR
jgi:phosphoribosylglycinamide formyltransferase 1